LAQQTDKNREVITSRFFIIFAGLESDRYEEIIFELVSFDGGMRLFAGAYDHDRGE
jgi:hypothetical protein